MLKLQEIKFGVIAHDTVTAIKGTVTAKCERDNGLHQVCIEGSDTTGRAFLEWVDLGRLELDNP